MAEKKILGEENFMAEKKSWERKNSRQKKNLGEENFMAEKKIL
jgi:hypothetical protein